MTTTFRGFLPYGTGDGLLFVVRAKLACVAFLGDAPVPGLTHPDKPEPEWREVVVNCYQESPTTSHLQQIWLVGDAKGYASCEVRGVRCIPLCFTYPSGTSWPVVKSARITIEAVQ
jgi:hypothetical protein